MGALRRDRLCVSRDVRMHRNHMRCSWVFGLGRKKNPRGGGGWLGLVGGCASSG